MRCDACHHPEIFILVHVLLIPLQLRVLEVAAVVHVLLLPLLLPLLLQRLLPLACHHVATNIGPPGTCSGKA